MSDKLLIFIVYLIRHHERRTNTESIRNSYILFLHKYPSYVCEAYPRLTVSRTYGHVFIGTQLRNAIPAETYTPARLWDIYLPWIPPLSFIVSFIFIVWINKNEI